MDSHQLDQHLSIARNALDVELAAYESNSVDYPQAWIATGQACWWAITLDDHLQSRGQYKRDRDADGSEGRFVVGLRYARNQFAHRLERLTARHTGAFGPEFSRDFDRVRLEWVRDDQPVKREYRHHQAIYNDHLAGQEIGQVMAQCAAWFDRYLRVLCLAGEGARRRTVPRVDRRRGALARSQSLKIIPLGSHRLGGVFYGVSGVFLEF